MAVRDGENINGENQAKDDVNNTSGSSLEEQKNCLKELLLTPLSKGETWYLIDSRWFKQWKKFVGYESWENEKAGMESMNPGPIDNSGLFASNNYDKLKSHLIDKLDYVLLPTKAWEKLAAWYGIRHEEAVIARKVVEHVMFVKHCKVEVYLVELKLCCNSDMETFHIRPFSRADTIGYIETVMRDMFEIAEDKESRLWNKYMSNTYQLLGKKEQTIQESGLYNGQVVVIEKKNDDGTWTREVSTRWTFASSPLSLAPIEDKEPEETWLD